MSKHAMPPTVITALLPLLLGACAMAPATTGSASVAGAIRVGNQAGPAMRVCAMPVGGGASHCTNVAAGAAWFPTLIAPETEALPAVAGVIAQAPSSSGSNAVIEIGFMGWAPLASRRPRRSSRLDRCRVWSGMRQR